MLAKQQPKPKQGVKLTAALPAELLFNRFYDTGKQTLLTQVTSPYRKPVEKPQASVPNISAPPRQQQFSMKNVFTKQQSSKKLEV